MSASQHRIGQYRILRKLGAGGMGMVFVGEHLLLGRRAAIKTLLPSLSAHPQIVEQFFNEARATSAIADPGIVQVFDFGYHVDGTAYIVMELLEGESLAHRIERLGSLPVTTALRIARQVASSVAAAHARDIVHRDLKPENIFLIRDAEAQGGERTKILDFGICKIGHAGDGPLSVFGTPVYMSPEQCRGDTERVDHRSDVYALGCVLFEMLTGRAPFERQSVEEVVEAHKHEAPPPAQQFAPETPALVDELLARCLAKDPAERFESMAALAVALGEVLARLSAPPAAVADTAASQSGERPAVVPLGDGFRSVFDGNVNPSPPPTVVARPRSTSVTIERPRRSAWRRAAFAMVLLGGLGAAWTVSRFTGAGEVAATAAATRGGADLVEPAAASPAPAAAPIAAPAPAPIVTPLPEPAPVKEATVARGDAPPPPTRTASRRARSAPPRQVTPPPIAAPTEDLYDTR